MPKALIRLHRKTVLRSVRLLQSRFGSRALLVSLAMIIGAAAAAAAAALHALVTLLERFGLYLDATGKPGYFALFLVLPLIGLSLSLLVQRTLGGFRYAKSLSPLILALDRRKFRIPTSEIFTHMLSSGLSVGCGGSAGLEAPSVLTGAALGSNLAGFLNIDRRQRNLLLSCGAAAAISAIFNSPIGGVLFTVEVLLPHFSVSSLVPILISSAVATVCSRLIAPGEQVLLAINVPWRTNAIPFYFLCGAVCALIGVFVIRGAYRTTDFLKRRFRSVYWRLFTGGCTLCLLLALFPLLRGQGYLMIAKLFSGDLAGIAASSPLLGRFLPQPVLLVLLLAAGIFLKLFASVLTVESGGDGGIFAPSMFIGAFTGFSFARLVNLTGLIQLQEPNFVVVGMCGVFTAVMSAPLTGIFLIAEVTGSYILLVPLMIVSAVAWFIARRFERHSIYRKVLIENRLLTDDPDESMLRSFSVRLSLEKNYRILSPDMSCDSLRQILERNPHQPVFPVLDDKKHLLGIVHLEKILAVLLDPEMSRMLLVFDLMETPRGQLSEEDDLAWALANMEQYNQQYLPVSDRSGKYLGVISRTGLFRRYRLQVRNADSF